MISHNIAPRLCVRLDNLIYSHDGKEVLAVLDWELSTLGDPVSDLAYVCIPYHMEPDQPHLKGVYDLINLTKFGVLLQTRSVL